MRKFKAVLDHLKAGHDYEWIALDSFTCMAQAMLGEFQTNPAKYGCVNKSGKFDGLAMYGSLKKYFKKMMESFLALPNCSKLVLFGATEKSEGVDPRIEVTIPGSYAEDAPYVFDEFYGLKVNTDKERQLVTGNDGAWISKSRMSGGAGDVLELYEPADIATIIEKCYVQK